jgi:hypothetical protein
MDAKQIKEEFLNVLDLLLVEARKYFKESAEIEYLEGQILKGSVDGVPLLEQINSDTFYNDHVSFSNNNKTIKIKVQSCAYRIPNTYHALLLLRKKIKALSTNSKPYDWHINKPSLKPKGIDIHQIEIEAFRDLSGLYYDYRRNLNLNECEKIKADLKENCFELYEEIISHEEREREYLPESYNQYTKWALTDFNEHNKFKKILDQIYKKEITLKSLTWIISHKTPTMRDIEERFNKSGCDLAANLKMIEKIKEEIKALFPDLYNEMFNLEQAA